MKKIITAMIVAICGGSLAFGAMCFISAVIEWSFPISTPMFAFARTIGICAFTGLLIGGLALKDEKP